VLTYVEYVDVVVEKIIAIRRQQLAANDLRDKLNKYLKAVSGLDDLVSSYYA
jgi:hypothetical protein